MTNKVLIAGAGIVGGILGKILKQNKVPFQIIEKEKGSRVNPNRTVALTKDSLVFLNSLDKKMDLNEWSTPIKQMKLYKDDRLNLELSSDDYEKLSSVCSFDDVTPTPTAMANAYIEINRNGAFRYSNTR